MKRAFTFIEVAILIASVIVVGRIGTLAHRWMWEQAELLSYRATMQNLTNTVRTMLPRAQAQHQIVFLRVDASHGAFQLATRQGTIKPYETVEQTIWLPGGLQISEAPSVLTAFPTGHLSSASIVVSAPAYNKLFRVTTDESGQVQLHEEETL